MRAIIWVIAVLIFLIPAAYIGARIYLAPSKNDVQAQMDYIATWKNFADLKQTDVSKIGGTEPDNDFVRLMADYLNKNSDIEVRLANAKNNMSLLVRAQNIASTPNTYELLEKLDVYQKDLQAVFNDYEEATKTLVDKAQQLDRKKLKIDVVAFLEEVNANKPKDEQEIQQYVTMAQNVKALLEFVNTRKGYYQLGNDNFLHFTRPEDEQYYVKVMTVLSKNESMIQNLRDQNIKSIRVFVNQMGG